MGALMEMPFRELVRMVEEASIDEPDVTIGELAQRFGVTTRRIMDAIDAGKN